MQNNINNIASNTPSALATNKVLRNTYALLGVSLFPTVIGALMGMSMNWGFAASSPILFMIMTLGGIFGMFFLIQKNKNSSLGVVFLLALTFLLGLMLGPILQVAFSLSNGGQIVSLAAGGDRSYFSCASRYSSNIQKRLLVYGKISYDRLNYANSCIFSEYVFSDSCRITCNFRDSCDDLLRLHFVRC